MKKKVPFERVFGAVLAAAVVGSVVAQNSGQNCAKSILRRLNWPVQESPPCGSDNCADFWYCDQPDQYLDTTPGTGLQNCGHATWVNGQYRYWRNGVCEDGVCIIGPDS